MTATASWSFQCDICQAHATVAGTDLKEAENTLVSVLHWEAPGDWRHTCEKHNKKAGV
jgi:hypothetical protein